MLSAQAALGAPILVLTNAASPFSQFYEQILLTEGMNEYALNDISSVTNGTLAQYDVAILAQTALTSTQVTTISNWVNGGGILIAMRPDKQLAGLLGLVDAGSTISEGYLLVNTNSSPGAGIINQTIQFHGTADAYTLSGATSLATLYTNAGTPTVNPAVTWRSVGSNGGQAAAFTYNLAPSIIFTRQGNPAWAGQMRDGLSPTRSDDLFYGPASFDLETNYVDFNKIAIPQADEQQRLLANMIISMNSAKRLLPRFWYFPHGYRAAVVMTGDDHANGGTAGRFNQYLAYSPTNGTVADWTAIRGSSYIYTGPLLTNAQAAAYNAVGFEIALHLNTGCANWDFSSLDAFFVAQLSQFTNWLPSLPPSATHRVHCVAWSDYSSMPQDELLHGIRFDTSYYYYPSNWINNLPGIFTGSAMPMRFATTNGNLIDVYQAPTFMTDESGQSYPYTVNTLLDRALGPEEYYGAYTCNMHTDYANEPSSDLIIMAAINRAVPVIAARQMLTWLDARNVSSFGSINWTNHTLTFSVNANASAVGLQAMAPIPSGYSVSTVTSNGVSIGYYLRGVNGMQYAFFNALTGNYAVTFQTDSIPPSVTSILPANSATGVSQTAKVIVTFSEALNPSTISTNTISLRDPTNGLVPATVSYNPSTFTAILIPNAPLALATNYTVTVKGGAGKVADVAGNPLASDFTSSFATIAQIDYSIWNNSTEPAVASETDTNSIEVGLKFQSAVNGYITGIRFFKGVFDKGPHVGSLWTTNGALLASVTFTNETVAGWQSQALAAPVPINANTTYVVSYHAPMGGYASAVGYFAGAGVTNYPLKALADGQNGGNGVYNYSTNSVFPNQTFSSENYWVDVVFDAGNALVITTASLANGIPGAPYSTNLTASGGTTPYTWSIISGSLPPGLTLNTNSGAITGTPTSTGIFSFTVQVSDVSIPAQTTTKPLSITITTLSGLTIWPGSSVPGTVDGGLDSPVELGVKFRSDAAGSITSIRFYKASANTNTHVGNLWSASGSRLATATFTNETASGWQQVNFTNPVPINANTVYVASYHCNNGHYSADDNYFSSSGADNPPLHALANGVSGPNGVFTYGASSLFPTNGFNADNYWVDVAFSTDIAPVLPVQTNRVINELATLTVTNTATDTDTSANALSYTLSATSLNTGAGESGNTTVTNASISTNGIITWTPAQTQSHSTNVFTTTVSDGSLSATNSFIVTVNEVNIAPVLTNQSNLTNSGLATVVVTNTASEPNIHSLTKGYGLLAGPAGASIDTNGIIRWTPTVLQVPGVYPITTVVTNSNPYDLINPQLTATNSFTVTEQAVHNGPGLGSQNNVTTNELALLVVTNSASDSDVPPLALSYTLLVTNLGTGLAVTNAVIDTNGVISWTPSEAQGPSSNRVTTVVSDGSLSATNSFVVTVNEVNSAPTFLVAQTNRTLVGLQSLTVTNTASDSDIPINPLGYQLTGSPPAGAVIDTNGVIRWTPTVLQVPGVYTITTVVTDTNVYAVNAQNLSATNSFTVTVQAIHNGPSLGSPGDVTTNELALLVVTNSASDSDVPPLALTYTLGVVTVTNQVGNSAVTNAVIDTNGVINWMPSEAQGPGVYVLTTVVSDGSLSATNNFTVTVNEVNSAPVLTLPQNTNIVEQAAWSAVATATDSDIPANPLTFALISGPAGLTVTTNGVITWTPAQTQALNTYMVTVSVTDTNPPAVNAKSLSVTNSFQITVNLATNDFRILSINTSNGVATITWTSVAGNYYRLQYKNSLTAAIWSDVIPDIMATNQTASMTNVIGGATQRFYRVMLVQTTDVPRPVIQSIGVTNGTATLTWSAVPPHIYRLQYTGSLTSANWSAVVPDVTATSQTVITTDVVGVSTQRFYRVLVVQ
jgi:hypothetical protein